MTGIAVDILLGLAVVSELICCVAILIMRNASERQHYLTPASIYGPILIAIAVIVAKSGTQADIKAVMIAVIVVATGPVVGHVIAQAVAAVDDARERNQQSN